MEKHTIELSAKELLLIARMTGLLLGYAVPDRYCDRELVLSIFNRANEKLSELLTAGEPIWRRPGDRVKPATNGVSSALSQRLVE